MWSLLQRVFAHLGGYRLRFLILVLSISVVLIFYTILGSTRFVTFFFLCSFHVCLSIFWYKRISVWTNKYFVKMIYEYTVPYNLNIGLDFLVFPDLKVSPFRVIIGTYLWTLYLHYNVFNMVNESSSY